jgi:hypothetical protein
MSGEQMSKEVKTFCNEILSTLRALEEGTPWANKAELYIGLPKGAVKKDMKDQDAPMVFWDYCIERRAKIHNLTAKANFKLHGSNPYTFTIGEEGDSYNLCQFGWYEWYYFREHTAAFTNQREDLGRVLGPERGEDNEMCQCVLKGNGKVVPRRSVRPLNPSEIHSEMEIKKGQVFDESIKRRHGTSINPPKPMKGNPDTTKPNYDIVDVDNELAGDLPDIEGILDSTGKVLNQQPMWDNLIKAEILLQQGDKMQLGEVIRRSVDDSGKTIGTYSDNPKMNSIIYEVEFNDGELKEYAANILAENMLSQIDDEGQNILLMRMAVVQFQ